VHIGQHKTGSSSIQDALIKNSLLLRENNLYFFSKKPNGDIDGSTNEWVDQSWHYENINQIRNPEEFALQASKLPGNVIISAESFSWVDNIASLELFKKNLNFYFKNVIIIVYIRRQDKQIISHYQEETKGGVHQPPYNFYPSGNTSIPPYEKYFDKYLDYYYRLSRWGDVFGDQNITIRIFEKNELYKNDVVLDFFKILGIYENIISSRINESWSFQQTKVGFLMSNIRMNKYLKKIIHINLDHNSKLMPSSKEAKKFYTIYKQSNQLLNNRFRIKKNNIYDEDFSMYSESGNDKWTEDSANEAISNILKAINNLKAKDIIIIALRTKLLFLKNKFKFLFSIKRKKNSYRDSEKL
tara:strand:+ start:288 stop:1355 length:1068 start_codon:yes stop_codon:yes gene_type:complete